MTTMSARQRAMSRIFMHYPMASEPWIFCISTSYWQIAIEEGGSKPTRFKQTIVAAVVLEEMKRMTKLRAFSFLRDHLSQGVCLEFLDTKGNVSQ